MANGCCRYGCADCDRGCVVYLLLPKAKNFKPEKNVSLSIHIKRVATHLRTPELWTAMLIGGVNFALFINLFSVMGLRTGSASLFYACQYRFHDLSLLSQW